MTCKVWVTGYGGFMGVHLVDLLEKKNEDVLATYFRPTTDLRSSRPRGRVEECDIRDQAKVNTLLKEFRPEKIFHLAAQSYPTTSWEDPWYTMETNVIGTINLFEAVKQAGLDCKILNACSSAEYGFVTEDEVPVREDHALKPLHPYGVSKVSQEMLGYQYFKNFNIKSIAVRIFNTTGPGKINDVCADFTQRLVKMRKGIKAGKQLRVGNLETRRAIIDVRDVVRAFDLSLDKATIGEVYNLSGNRVYAIQEIVDILHRLTGFDFELWQDPKLLRPTDEPIIFGDSRKFQQETGWQQEIPLEKTLGDMLVYWEKIL
ncbi:MAG TPA: GDP-mannose 4,6-dehydratase [Candidatus Competibacter sp.]|nr:GDP-mannose 4,6-dehydratase [Candidatus Competibacter sp.]